MSGIEDDEASAFLSLFVGRIAKRIVQAFLVVVFADAFLRRAGELLLEDLVPEERGDGAVHGGLERVGA